MPLPATDNFTRADSGSLGANWTEQTHGLRILSNKAITINDSTYQKVFWNADVFANDQYSELTATFDITGGQQGPMVRASGTDGGGTTQFYWMYCSKLDAETRLYFYNGSFNQIGTTITTAWADGDVARIEVSGTAFTLKRNGTTISTGLTDANISSGSAGFILENVSAAASLWTGDNLGGAVLNRFFLIPS